MKYFFKLFIDFTILSLPIHSSSHIPTVEEVTMSLNAHISKIDLSEPFVHPPRMVTLTDINFLVHFPSLTELNLDSCSDLGDNYHVVSNLVYLKKLNISEIGFTTLIYLRPLTNLTDLDVSGEHKDVTSIEDILYLTNLKKLNLRLAKNLLDIERIASLTLLVNLNLECIFNDDDRQYPTLDFLRPLVNLKKLKLGSNNHIKYLAPIANLPRLTYLSLNGNHSIYDWNSLGALITLKELQVQDTYIYERSDPATRSNLVFLNQLANLENLYISEWPDLYPLQLNDRLRIHHVGFVACTGSY